MIDEPQVRDILTENRRNVNSAAPRILGAALLFYGNRVMQGQAYIDSENLLRAGSSIYHALEFADNFFDDDEFEDMSGWGVEPDYTEEDAAWDADLRYYHDIEESWGDECPEIEY